MAPSSRPLHVALLRGINVGGKNRLAMRDLVAIFEAAGATEVRTYIQSGNVVFRATARVAKHLAGAVTSAIAERHDIQIPVVLFTAAELAAVLESNPFLERADPATLHVVFLRERPTPEAVAKLAPDRSPPDQFIVVGRHVYLHCPAGVADSKLSNAWFDKTLSTVSTGRNWRTVRHLAGMCGIEV